MSTRPARSEMAASIAAVAAPFVQPLKIMSTFTEDGSRLRLEVFDGESSVLEWELLAEYTRDPDRLTKILDDLRLSLISMGYTVGPSHLRSH
jgi:hypothetical protein